MGRPTINDLAAEAGVSLATVDRVLNGRAGVREATVARVNEAIERIGYVRDPFAASLARRRDFRVLAFVPDGDGQFLGEVRAAVQKTAISLLSDRVVLDLELFRPDPHVFAARLGAIDPEDVDGVILMAPETPHLRDAVRHLRERGVATAAIISDLPNSRVDYFIGINNLNAGRTAASLLGRFLGPGPARIAVIADTLTARDSLDRRLGFDRVMAEDFPEIEVLPTVEGRGDPQGLEAALRNLLRSFPDLRGVYSMGGGNRLLLEFLARSGLTPRPRVVVHELTPTTRQGLQTGQIDAVITQDLGHILRSAIRRLRAGRDNRPILQEQERIRIEILVRDNLY
ncbi:LacI family DNA-binding transcriptional regulator [Tabrizicola sp. J26]|uniref:LacI family DNA-binding transcriptional regulator n=1 Tax=Alitabrizicola rongguiensis TaxID=2909234 RepID=UPI001F3431A2|nr:LacI family DNA-binding transcriptional regulator [Tabrizicola rongguiensis]MCF1710858.1 LacI family DNA-binding transcriptional regulator [Tabrizicola rongguiensis]